MVPVIPVIPKRLEKKLEQSSGRTYAEAGNTEEFKHSSSEQRRSLAVKSPNNVKTKEEPNPTETETKAKAKPQSDEGRHSCAEICIL